MAMLDGVPKKHMSGGNVEREKFNEKASSKPKDKGGDKKPKSEDAPEGEPTTTITHHADGTHTAAHSDGETSDHPTSGHLAMALHAKHGDGEGMHVSKNMDGVTTHHVGMDGQVQGPDQHGSLDEAQQHMTQMLGEDGGNGAVEMTDGETDPMMSKPAGHDMPALY